jgi:hypothetical protein
MDREFQRITANLAGTVRHDRMGGRDYLVVPMVMMCEGVHAGTNGPLYYPADEMARNVGVWDHKPIVIYHPTANGRAMSACQPDVITSRGVGVVMNTRFEDSKWKAEAWLEETRLKQVDNRVLEMLETNKMCEVSTGLFTENEVTPGTWNGEQYGAIARNYGPDHLAILPDQVGACSIKDGAGLLRANSADLQENRFFSTKERKTMDAADFGDPDRRAYPVRDQADLENAARLVGHAGNPAAVKERLTTIAKRKGLKLPAAWQDKTHNTAMAHNASSFNRITGMIDRKLRDTHGGDYGSDMYIHDVYPDSFIFSHAGDMYRVGYKEKDGDVKITTDPEPVVRHMEYRTLEGAYVGNTATSHTSTPEPTVMEKKQVVDTLIANGGWVEGDRDFLMGLTDDRLKLIGKAPTANAEKPAPVATPAPAPVANTTPTPAPVAPVAPVVNAADVLNALRSLTPEQYIANAPVGMRAMMLDGMAAANAEKARLVTEITANAANTYTADALNAMELSALRPIAALARGSAGANMDPLLAALRLPPNYAGAAGAPVGNVGAPAVEGLPVPVMNFEVAK